MAKKEIKKLNKIHPSEGLFHSTRDAMTVGGEQATKMRMQLGARNQKAANKVSTWVLTLDSWVHCRGTRPGASPDKRLQQQHRYSLMKKKKKKKTPPSRHKSIPRHTHAHPREHIHPPARPDETRRDLDQLEMTSFTCFCCCLKQDHLLTSSSLLSSFFFPHSHLSPPVQLAYQLPLHSLSLSPFAHIAIVIHFQACFDSKIAITHSLIHRARQRHIQLDSKNIVVPISCHSI